MRAVFRPIVLFQQRAASSHAGTVALAYNRVGDASPAKGTPLVIGHGLFGQKQNWNSVSKALHKKLNAPVYVVDHRNHGESPWVDEHTYERMTDDLERFVKEVVQKETGHEHINLLGHSMGGKIAALFAIQGGTQKLLNKLIIEDVAPQRESSRSLFLGYVEALRELDLSKPRKELLADLEKVVPDQTVREFLLTNLAVDPENRNHFKWKVNLDAIGGFLEHVIHFRIKDGIFRGPSILIHGENSDFVREDDKPEIKAFFPNIRFHPIARAGHWVHAENPGDFVDACQVSTIKRLNDLKVSELRDQLGQRGLVKEGVKSALIERLATALKAAGHDSESFEFHIRTEKTPERPPRPERKSKTPDEHPKKHEKEHDNADDPPAQPPVQLTVERIAQSFAEPTDLPTTDTPIEWSNTPADGSSKEPKAQKEETPPTTIAEPPVLVEQQPVEVFEVEDEEPAESPQPAADEPKSSEPQPPEKPTTPVVSATPVSQKPEEEKEDVKADGSNTTTPQPTGSLPDTPKKPNVPDAPKKANEQNAKRTTEDSFWLSNIPPQTTAAELKALVSEHAPAISAKIFMGKRDDCYGLLTMLRPEGVQVAISKLHRTMFKGFVLSAHQEKVVPKRPAIEAPAAEPAEAKEKPSDGAHPPSKKPKIVAPEASPKPDSSGRSKSTTSGSSSEGRKKDHPQITIDDEKAASPRDAQKRRSEPKVPIRAPERSPRRDTREHERSTSRSRTQTRDIRERPVEERRPIRSESANYRRSAPNPVVSNRDREYDDRRPRRDLPPTRYVADERERDFDRRPQGPPPVHRPHGEYYDKEEVMQMLLNQKRDFEAREAAIENERILAAIRLEKAELEKKRLEFENKQYEAFMLQQQQQQQLQQQMQHAPIVPAAVPFPPPASSMSATARATLEKQEKAAAAARAPIQPVSSYNRGSDVRSSDARGDSTAINSNSSSSHRPRDSRDSHRSRSPHRSVGSGRSRTSDSAGYVDSARRDSSSTATRGRDRPSVDSSDYYANRSTSNRTTGDSSARGSYSSNYNRSSTNYSAAAGYQQTPAADSTNRTEKRVSNSSNGRQDSSSSSAHRSSGSYSRPATESSFANTTGGGSRGGYRYQLENDPTNYPRTGHSGPAYSSYPSAQRDLPPHPAVAEYTRPTAAPTSSFRYDAVPPSSYSTASSGQPEANWNAGSNYSSADWSRSNSGWNGNAGGHESTATTKSAYYSSRR